MGIAMDEETEGIIISLVVGVLVMACIWLPTWCFRPGKEYDRSEEYEQLEEILERADDDV